MIEVRELLGPRPHPAHVFLLMKHIDAAMEQLGWDALPVLAVAVRESDGIKLHTINGWGGALEQLRDPGDAIAFLAAAYEDSAAGPRYAGEDCPTTPCAYHPEALGVVFVSETTVEREDRDGMGTAQARLTMLMDSTFEPRVLLTQPGVMVVSEHGEVVVDGVVRDLIRLTRAIL